MPMTGDLISKAEAFNVNLIEMQDDREYEYEIELVRDLVTKIKRLQECCEKYGKKVMRQEASMLKVITRNREQRKQLAAKDIELNNALSDLKHEKERVEIMHLRRENELRQMNELGTQNKDLMANCNQLRDRCWKAESELARWQQIVIDERAAKIQEANSGDFVDAQGNHIFQVMDIEKCRELAARELNLRMTQEAGYVEQLEKDFIFYARSYEYTRDPNTWKPHQERYEEAEHKAQAALAKIRAGK